MPISREQLMRGAVPVLALALLVLMLTSGLARAQGLSCLFRPEGCEPVGAATPAPTVNGCTIQPVAQCPGANLQGASLGNASLIAANLAGATLIVANLSGANLTTADLTGASMISVNLSGANLFATNLSGADLTLATLSGATMTSANLTGAILARATLTGTVLSNADLTRADLGGANLIVADLSGANLTGANLSGTNLTGAHWNGATCPDGTPSTGDASGCAGSVQNTTTPTPTPSATNPFIGFGEPLGGPRRAPGSTPLTPTATPGLTATPTPTATAGPSSAPAPVVNGCTIQAGAQCPGANLLGANLSGANLHGSNLRGATLGRANLSNSDLGAADLSNSDLGTANLTGAILAGANLSGANMLNATVTGAHWSGATCPDGTPSTGDMNGCKVPATIGVPRIPQPDVTAQAGVAFDYEVGWEVTDPLVWRDLDQALIALTDQSGTGDAFVITLQERDGPDSTLEASASDLVSLNVDASQIEGSGPTGRTVTVVLNLTFSPAAAGDTFTLNIAVRTHGGDYQEMDSLGTISVQ